jgi:hypothetical protein
MVLFKNAKKEIQDRENIMIVRPLPPACSLSCLLILLACTISFGFVILPRPLAGSGLTTRQPLKELFLARNFLGSKTGCLFLPLFFRNRGQVRDVEELENRVIVLILLDREVQLVVALVLEDDTEREVRGTTEAYRTAVVPGNTGPGDTVWVGSKEKDARDEEVFD